MSIHLKTQKMTMRIRILIFISIFLSSLHAQNSMYQKHPDVNPITPDVATLTNYINFPVNYYGGLVDVNIPLFEIKAGDITIPISLSYHSGGYRPEDPRSWVGQGWSISAEPLLGRTICGKDDFRPGGYYSRGAAEGYPSIDDLIYYADGVWEMEPDEFYYKLPDKSGTFYFSKKGVNGFCSIVPNPYAPLDISLKNYGTRSQSFDIIDEKGIQYHFGRSLRKNEDKNETSEIGTELTVSSWKATEMISANTSDTVFFSYDDGIRRKLPYNKSNDFMVIEDSLDSQFSPPDFYKNIPNVKTMVDGRTYYYKIDNLYDNDDNFISWHLEPEHDYPYLWLDTYLTELRLKKIDYRGGTVEFQKDIYGNLINIYVKRTNGSLVKRIYFSYNEFSVRKANEYSLLKSISVFDSNNMYLESYQLEYYEARDPVMEYGPDAYRSSDSWGFYKEFITNSYSYPHNGQFPHINDMKVLIDASKRKYRHLYGGGASVGVGSEGTMGCLKLITYPTGGSTRFIYEHHLVSSKNIQKTVGGLRIAELQNYDPVSDITTVRKFKYGVNERGTGRAKSDFGVEDYMVEQLCFYRDTKAGYYSSSRRRTFYGAPLGSLLGASGTAAVYESVAEYLYSMQGGQLKPKGKTVYSYRVNPEDNRFYHIRGTSIILNPREEWKGGLLVGKSVYEYIYDTYFLTVHEGYEYKEEYTADIPTGKNFREILLLGADFQDNPMLKRTMEQIRLHQYNIKCGRMLLMSDTSIVYRYGTESKTVRQYEYATNIAGNNFVQTPICVKKMASNGEIVTDRYDYAFNSSSYSSESLRRERRLTTLLQHSHEKKDSIFVDKWNYENMDGKMALKSISSNKQGVPNAVSLEFYKYDSFKNPLFLTQNQLLPIVYIWGYEHTYPLAIIKNANYQQVCDVLSVLFINQLAKKTTVTASDWNTLYTLRDKLPQAHIVYYDYLPHVGIISEIQPNRNKLMYEYDTSGRLMRIKDNAGKILKEYIYHYK